eukprot:TRINITY_DN11977_c0_g1_i4.p1 TRINITY_DN11977_c0_g1~~TRINITY_DN11977_c0_g1_i4.p1  ORF type:complete len:330 (+),score=62.34 TRINITY_DN11977_c0_g1_i4:217-1206(+)
MNVLVQQALPSNSPGGSIVFSFLRDAIASPVLTAAMLVTKSYVRPKAKDLVKLLVVMGALGMSGNQTFFVLGLDIVGSDIAAVYNCAGPSIMFIMAVALRLERFSWTKLLGVVLGVVGIVFLSQLWKLSFGQDLLGHAFLLLSVIFSQLFYIVQKYLHGYPALMMTTVAYWAAVFTIAIPAFIYSQVLQKQGIWPESHFQWGVVVYAGVISSALNYYLLTLAISHLTPLVLSIYGATQPVVTDLMNYVFVGKGLSGWDALGSVLIIASVFVTIYGQEMLDREVDQDVDEMQHDRVLCHNKDECEFKHDAAGQVADSCVQRRENLGPSEH